jgi:DNA repair exonuclease SbcCD ATPase subunit
MKIESLYLKNFAHIYSGLGKYEISIDLSKSNKIINLIIGKMGSCKSIILGHLQPFSSLGTLDIRNQDNVALDEMDGLKRIVYTVGPNEYVITHNYIWNKTTSTHNVKSYIEKNGQELNPNGNQSSFKDLVETELGLNQNFLRIIRLGPNVTNIIEMKSTERKALIASMLSDAEIFITIYKCLNESLKKLNIENSMLANKLNQIASHEENFEDTVESEISSATEKISSLMEEKERLSSAIYKIRASIQLLLHNESIEDYSNSILELQNEKSKKELEINNLQELLNSFKEMPPIDTINQSIGKLDESISHSTEERSKLEESLENISSELAILLDTQKMSQDESHIETLQKQYQNILETINKTQSELKNFNCDYSSTFLTSFNGDLNQINIMIEDLTQYNEDLIQRIYRSDHTCISYSKKQIEYLNYKKLKLQKEMNNIRYSATYSAPYPLFRPSFCPTKNCPYYVTHPYRIQDTILKDDDSEMTLQRYQNNLENIDVQINIFNEYPYIYSKISSLRGLWKKAVPILQKIGALKTSDLLQALTNLEKRRWYDYDKLIEVTDLATKRENYYELIEKMKTIKGELDRLAISDFRSLSEKIDSKRKEHTEVLEKIKALDQEIKDKTEELKKYNQLYLDLSQKSIYESNLKEFQNQFDEFTHTIEEMKRDIQSASDQNIILKKDLLDLNSVAVELSSLQEKNEKNKLALKDWKYTKEEFNRSLQERDTLKLMLDASSSKKGMPLVMIQLFLADTRDTVNELISDVFGDTIEIGKIIVNENEFNIPYYINGTYVNDISKASQGQRSIISIAFSFALIQKYSQKESTVPYNIPLLDEVDAPLYIEDREKFITILLRHIQTIHAEQAFLISHNHTFEGQPVNVIMTTDEIIDKTPNMTVMHI